MKKTIFTIVLISLLSSCAKVYQEPIPCTGNKPATPIVQDVIIQLGYTVNVTAQADPNATISWTGPHNFTANTSPGNSLALNFLDSTNYGLYTATAYVNGCASNPDTFNVSGNFIGNVPCTISPSNYNKLIGSNGTSFYFSSPAYSQSGYCYNSIIDMNNTTTSGYTFDFYTQNYTTVGSYYMLGASCSVGPGQGYVNISTVDIYGNVTPYYQSVNGRAYCSLIGGQYYITFCGATFKKVSDGSTFSVTGNIQYY